MSNLLLPQPLLNGTERSYTISNLWEGTRAKGNTPLERQLLNLVLPPWQRPAVWSESQQVSFLEGIFLGLGTGYYVINGRDWNDEGNDSPMSGWLIDGQQRITAIHALSAAAGSYTRAHANDQSRRAAIMTRRSTFKHQMLGFYFNINGLRRREGSEPIEAEIQAAATIYVRAYEKLQQTLPSSPSWLKRDDVNPEITYSPFELCEESLDEAEIEGTDGLLGFSFWLFSYHKVEAAEVLAFRQEVISAFNAAAVELGGQAQLIRVEARVTEEVTQTSVVDLEPNSR